MERHNSARQKCGDISVINMEILLTACSFSSLNVYRGVLEAVLELMLPIKRSLRLILSIDQSLASDVQVEFCLFFEC